MRSSGWNSEASAVSQLDTSRVEYDGAYHTCADWSCRSACNARRSGRDNINMIKIILLLHRRADLSIEEFRAYWHGPHQALLVRLPGLRRLLLNDVLPGPDGSPGPCDGISEDWFESPEAMQAAFASPEGQAVAADTPNFLDPSRLQTVFVDEHEAPLPGAQT